MRGRSWLGAALGTALVLGCGEGPAAKAPPSPDAAASPAPAPAASEATAAAPPAPGPEVAEGPHPHLTLDVLGRGRIRIELLPEKAPKNVASLLDLASKGFYDGTTFHRVIPDFVLQGGDPNSKNRDPRDDGLGGPGYTLPDEFSDVKHTRGIVSMANTGDKNSAGSQFFIVLTDQPDFDGRYTVVGRVVEGMDVVDAIAKVETDLYGRWGAPDRPREDVVVTKATAEPAP